MFPFDWSVLERIINKNNFCSSGTDIFSTRYLHFRSKRFFSRGIMIGVIDYWRWKTLKSEMFRLWPRPNIEIDHKYEDYITCIMKKRNQTYNVQFRKFFIFPRNKFWVFSVIPPPPALLTEILFPPPSWCSAEQYGSSFCLI